MLLELFVGVIDAKLLETVILGKYYSFFVGILSNLVY